MTSPLTIVLSAKAHARYWTRIAAVAPHAVARVLPSGDERMTALDEIDVIWSTNDMWQDGLIRKLYGTASRATNLKWFSGSAAGVDQPVFAAIARLGGRVTSAHVNSIPIAEYVLHGVLDVVRQSALDRAAQARHEWEQRPVIQEIMGTTWTIVGFGAIGREVAVRARAFGATVRSVRRTPSPNDPVDAAYTPDRMGDALSGADVIVLCAPLDASTANMADASFFAACEPGSVFVNVGRGGLVDEDALVRALAAGAPARAVLDVTRAEPLPAESPLWAHPQITVTPHLAGAGTGNDDRLCELFLANLRAFLAGEPLQHDETPRLLASTVNEG
ncbi:MAG: D-2-hydroxyacid dehydrogenase [Acidimicrobiia bacterium]